MKKAVAILIIFLSVKLYAYEPVVEEPNDFMEWWQEEIAEAKEFPLQYTEEAIENLSTDSVQCKLIKIQLPQKQCFYGYLFVPRNASERSCPVVLMPPGAGIKTIKNTAGKMYFPENNFILFMTEIHGIDPRCPEVYFQQMSNAFNSTNTGGYLRHCLNDRENYYMKHVYLAQLRAIDFLTSLPEWDGRNVIVSGNSQGGALSLVTACLDNRVTCCVANHPALTDMLGEGYPHFKDLTDEELKVLPYYDALNFARNIKVPVNTSWDTEDKTVYPSTSEAMYEALKCEKTHKVTTGNGHHIDIDTEMEQFEWVLNHLMK